MKQLFKKKQWMMVVLVLAMGAAVYLNYYLLEEPSLSAGTPSEEVSDTESDPHLGDATFVGTGVSDPNKTEQSDVSATYFDQARQNRMTAREEALSIIQEVLDSAQTSAQDKADASARATAIAENVLQESHIESLISAKGFEDSVVYIDGTRCSVVVKTEKLEPQESLQILGIVVSQSSVAADQVQIMAADE